MQGVIDQDRAGEAAVTTEADVAWFELACAEADHHVECACRAYAKLVALGEIVPEQRDAVE